MRKFWLVMMLCCVTIVAQAQTDICNTVVQSALEATSQACEGIGRNQACYGNGQIQAQARPNVNNFVFTQQGDIVNVGDLQSLTLSPFDAQKSLWGVSLMQLQANLPDSLPGQNVTFLMFGSVSADNTGDTALGAQPMESFYFQNGIGQEGCNQAPDGILIQTPQGARQITLIANDSTIQLGSTAYLQAQDGQLMTVSVIEGSGTIEAKGVTRVVPAGAQVTIPLDKNNRASGAPSDIAPYDATALENLPISLLPRAISIAPPLATADKATSLPTIDVTSATDIPVGTAFVAHLTFNADASACPDQSILPVDTVLVMDVSSSMTETGLPAAQRAALTYVNQLDPAKDRVSVVTFSNDAQTLTTLEDDFDASRAAIAGLSTLGGTAIDVGLQQGDREMDGARADARQVMVLLSDGGSDPETANAAANAIKDQNIQLITIGVGSAQRSLLLELASSPDLALYSVSAGGLDRLFNNTALQLTRPVAVRGLTIQLHLNTEAYAVIDTLLDSARVVADGVIEWSIADVYDGEQQDLSLPVRALKEGNASLGTLDYRYVECKNTRLVTPKAQTLPELSVVNAPSGDDISPEIGALHTNAVGTGNLEAFGIQQWLIDIATDTPFTLVLKGAGSDSPPLLQAGNEIYAPTYTSNGSSVFIPQHAGPFWAVVQSSSEKDSGSYTLSVMDGIADNAQELVFDQVLPASAAGVYAFDGKENDLVTTVLQSQSYLSNYYVVSVSDGQFGEQVGFISDANGQTNSSVIRLKGKGPYRLLMGDNVEYTLTASRGDTLTIDQGVLALDKAQDVTIPPNKLFQWTLADARDERITVAISGELGYSSRSVSLVDADGQTVYSDLGSNTDAYANYVFTLSGKAPYTLQIASAVPFTLAVNNGDTLTDDQGDLVFDTPISGDPSAGKVTTYHLDATAGDTITIDAGDTLFDSAIAVQDADGYTVYPDYTVGAFTVLTLTGKAPYAVMFTASSAYRVTVSKGDTVAASIEVLTFDQTVQGTLVENQPNIYKLDAKPDTTVSVTVTGGVYANVSITDAERNYLNYANTIAVTDGNVYLFRLTGKPPFLLTLQYGSGDYNLTVVEGNQVEDERGTLQAGVAEKGTMSDKVTAYRVDVTPNDIFTVRLATEEYAYVSIDVKDANGNYLSTIAQTTLAMGTVATYLAPADPTYVYLQATSGTDYTITVEQGDTLTDNQGEIPFGETASGTTPDGQITVYTLTAQEGDPITLDTGDTVFDTAMSVVDANNYTLYETYASGSMHVYDMTGTPPYRVLMQAKGDYTLTVVEGDAIQASIETLTFDTPFTGEFRENESLLIQLDAQENTTITLNVTSQSSPSVSILDADNIFVNYSANVYLADSVRYVFPLTGKAPYLLNLSYGTGAFSVTMTEGNTVQEARGVIEAGSAVSDVLDDKIVLYELAVTPTEAFTLKVTSNNGYVTADVKGTDGYSIYPTTQDYLNNGSLSTYPATSGTITLSLQGNANTTYTVVLTTPDKPTVDLGENSQPCTVRSSGSVNLRSGPGTSFGKAGQLSGGTDTTADGQALGSDGQVWWHFTSGEWVRSDLVEESGTCEFLPTLKP